MFAVVAWNVYSCWLSSWQLWAVDPVIVGFDYDCCGLMDVQLLAVCLVIVRRELYHWCCGLGSCGS